MVNDVATLQGSGSVGGLVTVASVGTLSPGNSLGKLTVGALTLSSNSLTKIELAGITPGAQYDQLHVTGDLAVGGKLDVSLIPGFTPTLNQAFDILNWGSLSGAFSSFSLPTLSRGLGWDVSELYLTGSLKVVSAGVPGDYNNNGIVDAADFVLWRKKGPLANEVDTPGLVNGADYNRGYRRPRTGVLSAADVHGGRLVSPATPGRIEKSQQLVNA
jgi:hypothetical protein